MPSPNAEFVASKAKLIEILTTSIPSLKREIIKQQERLTPSTQEVYLLNMGSLYMQVSSSLRIIVDLPWPDPVDNPPTGQVILDRLNHFEALFLSDILTLGMASMFTLLPPTADLVKHTDFALDPTSMPTPQEDLLKIKAALVALLRTAPITSPEYTEGQSALALLRSHLKA